MNAKTLLTVAGIALSLGSAAPAFADWYSPDGRKAAVEERAPDVARGPAVADGRYQPVDWRNDGRYGRRWDRDDDWRWRHRGEDWRWRRAREIEYREHNRGCWYEGRWYPRGEWYGRSFYPEGYARYYGR